MTNCRRFNFYLPSNISFGCGAIRSLPDLAELKGKNCLFLSFPGFDREKILPDLRTICRNVTVSSDFEENPSYAYIEALAQKVVSESIETIIAVGGGSTIDSAKAAAWMSANPKWQSNRNQAPNIPNIAVVAVPTTAGTGSEVTPYAILTNNITSEKEIISHPALFPKVAICDPELTVSLPERITANTGIDALSHAIEAYLSINCYGFLDLLALDVCNLIVANLPQVLAAPNDLVAREKIMLAALQGGIVLAHCGTVMVHALGYNLTRQFHYPHGFANGVLLAAFVERLSAKGSQKAQQIETIFKKDLDGFIRQCGIPTNLPTVNCSPDLLDIWVQNGYESYGRKNSVVSLEKADIEAILAKVFN